jgi:hypothetical protein
MTTSNSAVFTMTALQVVEKAFAKIGVKTAEQALEAHEYQDGQDSLNLMIKAWGAQGLHLWSKDEGILFLDVGKTDYLLGLTGDEACQIDDFISTTTTTTQITSDTVIPATSTAGMVAGDKIGIQLDDKTRHWTTIATVDSSVQVTIDTGLASSSTSGNTVFTFTNLIQRPKRILSFRRKTFANDNEIPVITWSRDQYFNQVNKISQGTVVNCYYSPQLTDGRLYVWQTASSVNDFVRFTYERPLEDILDKENTLDFPTEWLEAIIYNLAARLADDYDAPPFKVQSVTAKAVQFLDDLLGWDEEMTELNLQPDFD